MPDNSLKPICFTWHQYSSCGEVQAGTGRGELQHLALRISFRSFESFMVMQKKSEAVWGGINNKSSMHLSEAAEEPNLICPSRASPCSEIVHDGWVEYRWENSVLYWFKKKYLNALISRFTCSRDISLQINTVVCRFWLCLSFAMWNSSSPHAFWIRP